MSSWAQLVELVQDAWAFTLEHRLPEIFSPPAIMWIVILLWNLGRLNKPDASKMARGLTAIFLIISALGLANNVTRSHTEHETVITLVIDGYGIGHCVKAKDCSTEIIGRMLEDLARFGLQLQFTILKLCYAALPKDAIRHVAYGLLLAMQSTLEVVSNATKFLINLPSEMIARWRGLEPLLFRALWYIIKFLLRPKWIFNQIVAGVFYAIYRNHQHLQRLAREAEERETRRQERLGKSDSLASTSSSDCALEIRRLQNEGRRHDTTWRKCWCGERHGALPTRKSLPPPSTPIWVVPSQTRPKKPKPSPAASQPEKLASPEDAMFDLSPPHLPIKLEKYTPWEEQCKVQQKTQHKMVWAGPRMDTRRQPSSRPAMAKRHRHHVLGRGLPETWFNSPVISRTREASKPLEKPRPDEPAVDVPSTPNPVVVEALPSETPAGESPLVEPAEEIPLAEPAGSQDPSDVQQDDEDVPYSMFFHVSGSSQPETAGQDDDAADDAANDETALVLADETPDDEEVVQDEPLEVSEAPPSEPSEVFEGPPEDKLEVPKGLPDEPLGVAEEPLREAEEEAVAEPLRETEEAVVEPPVEPLEVAAAPSVEPLGVATAGDSEQEDQDVSMISTEEPHEGGHEERQTADVEMGERSPTPARQTAPQDDLARACETMSQWTVPPLESFLPSFSWGPPTAPVPSVASPAMPPSTPAVQLLAPQGSLFNPAISAQPAFAWSPPAAQTAPSQPLFSWPPPAAQTAPQQPAFSWPPPAAQTAPQQPVTPLKTSSSDATNQAAETPPSESKRAREAISGEPEPTSWFLSGSRVPSADEEMVQTRPILAPRPQRRPTTLNDGSVPPSEGMEVETSLQSPTQRTVPHPWRGKHGVLLEGIIATIIRVWGELDNDLETKFKGGDLCDRDVERLEQACADTKKFRRAWERVKKEVGLDLMQSLYSVMVKMDQHVTVGWGTRVDRDKFPIVRNYDRRVRELRMDAAAVTKHIAADVPDRHKEERRRHEGD